MPRPNGSKTETGEYDDGAIIRTGCTHDSRREAVLFCLLLSMMIFLFGGYSFGTRDHIEQLPMVLRYLDSAYCTNDFFVNAGTNFGPRYYYTRLLGLMVSIVPLPVLFAVLTWLSNFGISIVTYIAARRLSRGSDLAARIACTLAMGMPACTLGGVLPLAQVQLTPFGLAYPFALISLWAGIRGRPLLSVIPMIIICPIHPQVSLEIGSIALATSGLSVIIFHNTNLHPNKTHRTRQLIFVFAGYLLLGITIAAFWLPRIAPRTLDMDEFIQILGHFRHPHHYIPSTWNPFQYLWAIGFLLVFGFSWYSWYQRIHRDRIIAFRILVCFSIVFVLWCCGYVFVELIPSRFWTTAQAFRLSFVVNWLGFLVIARLIAFVIFDNRFVVSEEKLSQDSTSAIKTEPIISSGVISTPDRAMLIAFLLLFFIASGVILIGIGTLWNSVSFLLFPAFIVWFMFYLSLRRRTGAAVFFVSICLIAVVFGRHPTIPDVRSLIGELGPKIKLTETEDSSDRVAAYVRNNTPENAVFLTPPNFGRFRLTARRSIVIDFKAFPFQDWAIREWKLRLDDSYGKVDSIGFNAVKEMEENYRDIDTALILKIQRLYGISYAVLHAKTETCFAVLYSDENYKLVKVSPSAEENLSLKKEKQGVSK